VVKEGKVGKGDSERGGGGEAEKGRRVGGRKFGRNEGKMADRKGDKVGKKVDGWDLSRVGGSGLPFCVDGKTRQRQIPLDSK